MNRERTERQYNTQNLKPFNTMTAEEHRELSRRGGIASGKRRREQRQYIEECKLQDKAHREQDRESIELLYKTAKMYVMAKRAISKL